MDTVVVRGFDISDVEVHPVGSMSDHLLICCTLDPILGAPEWIDRTDRYAPYLGPEQRVVWKNRRLADITSVEGYADGAWLIGRTRAPGVITKRDATSMTVQFQALSGQCKAVRAHFRQQGADIVGRTDKAGYGDAALYGKPLPEDAFKYEVAQAATNGTYGVYDLAAFGRADKRTEAQARTGSFRVATWNIGHFSGGVSAVSSITKAMAPQRIADYRALLEEVNADLFGVCEYSPMLDKEQTIAVRSALFDNIITRGFVQKDPKVHAVGSLSDHMLLSCTLEPIPLK